LFIVAFGLKVASGNENVQCKYEGIEQKDNAIDV